MMIARKLLLLAIPGLVFLVVIALFCLGRSPVSAVSGGPEDAAIRMVEEIGGVRRRAAHVEGGRERDLLTQVQGNPVVEIDFSPGEVVVIRPPWMEDRVVDRDQPPGPVRVTDAALTKFHLLSELRKLSLRNTGVTDRGLK